MGGNFTEGDRVAGLYDRTGNMPVARTLDHYQKLRGQQGLKGKVYEPNDPNYGIQNVQGQEGRVFRDENDLAKQKSMENKNTPFQNRLRQEEENCCSSSKKC